VRVLRELGGLVALLALAGVNALWFHAAGDDYFGWFLDNGALVGFLFGIVSAAVQLDSHPDLVAAAPLVYVRGVVGAIGLEISMALWALFGDGERDGHVIDVVLAAAFMVALALALLAWALVVAPLQYLVNLVCGAPARVALGSHTTAWRVRRSALHTEYLKTPKLSEPFADPAARADLEQARARGDATEITWAARPVTTTAAVAAAVLFGVSQLV
jgi:hypothetical protein